MNIAALPPFPSLLLSLHIALPPDLLSFVYFHRYCLVEFRNTNQHDMLEDQPSMSEQREVVSGEDAGTSCSSFGSEDVAARYASCIVRPPKKRHFHIPSRKAELPDCSMANLSVPAALPDNAKAPPCVQIDLDALTYYPAYESSFDGPSNAQMKPAPLALSGERTVMHSEMSMRVAIRQIAKRRKRRLQALF